MYSHPYSCPILTVVSRMRPNFRNVARDVIKNYSIIVVEEDQTGSCCKEKEKEGAQVFASCFLHVALHPFSTNWTSLQKLFPRRFFFLRRYHSNSSYRFIRNDPINKSMDRACFRPQTCVANPFRNCLLAQKENHRKEKSGLLQMYHLPVRFWCTC